MTDIYATCIDGRTAEEVEAVMEFWKERGYELRPDGFYRYPLDSKKWYSMRKSWLVKSGKHVAQIYPLDDCAVMAINDEWRDDEEWATVTEAMFYFLRECSEAEYAFSFEDGCKQMEIGEVGF